LETQKNVRKEWIKKIVCFIEHAKVIRGLDIYYIDNWQSTVRRMSVESAYIPLMKTGRRATAGPLSHK